MPDRSPLRARLNALPVDRAPLRRAGVLTLLLVVLLGLTQAIRPEARPASEAFGRQDVHAETERVSATGGVPAGRVAAFLLLAAGGGVALWLRRRRPASEGTETRALEVLETHPLGQGHSLRLVACGDEVLLLDVGAEGARLLRQWPRVTFETGPAVAPPLAHVAAQTVRPEGAGLPPEVEAPEVAVLETAVPEAAPPATRPAAPRQFGAPTPSFADVLAQFAPARG